MDLALRRQVLRYRTLFDRCALLLLEYASINQKPQNLIRVPKKGFMHSITRITMEKMNAKEHAPTRTTKSTNNSFICRSNRQAFDIGVLACNLNPTIPTENQRRVQENHFVDDQSII
jgi:hypothetical protein